jgi:hypothetical protein
MEYQSTTAKPEEKTVEPLTRDIATHRHKNNHEEYYVILDGEWHHWNHLEFIWELSAFSDRELAMLLVASDGTEKGWGEAFKDSITAEKTFLTEPDELPEPRSVGLKPLNTHGEERLVDVKEAIARYLLADKQIPIEWLEEYNETVK